MAGRVEARKGADPRTGKTNSARPAALSIGLDGGGSQRKYEDAIMVNTALLSFAFVSTTLRVVMRDGEPWFVAADVCSALSISRTDDGVSRLDDDEKGTDSIRTPGGTQEMTIINESGLYSLILTSRKPEAKKFKKWVTSEVLPAIRKTGRYEARPAPVETAPEYLSAQDEQALAQIAWLCSQHLPCPKGAAHAFWHRMRQATGVPSPGRFEVRHLPVLAAEAMRFSAVTEAFRRVQYEAARKLTRRVLRTGADAEALLKEIAQELDAAIGETDAELQRRITPWQQRQIEALGRPL